MFIDSHAHLTGQPIDLEELQRAHEAGIQSIVNICTNSSSLELGLELAKKQKVPHVYTTAAVTPHDVITATEDFFSAIVRAAENGDLVAIGETGLDYYYEHSPKEQQIESLRKHLQLAVAFHLPVVIHCRDAFADFYTIFDEEIGLNKQAIRGVIHCFTGTQKEVDEAVKRGLFISLSGIVTFPKSKELQQIAKVIPIENILIETDSPYLAPQPHRGKKNEPAYLIETAAAVARLRGISLEELAEHTLQNTIELFQLS